MRYVLIALATLVSATASAQGGRGAHGSHPSGPPPRTTAPRTVAPPIVLPFPPLMAPPTGGLTHGFPFRPQNQRPRDGHRRRSSGVPYGSVGYGAFVGGYAGDSEVGVVPREPEAPATGALRLSVIPAAAQVFVDGLYVGSVADIEAQRVLMLEAGPHRIDFRAPQHDTLTVDLRIAPHDVVTYRGVLEPTRPPPPLAAPTAAQTTMYVIPKCYMGNVPPRPSRLPAGCDIKQVQVLGRK